MLSCLSNWRHYFGTREELLAEAKRRLSLLRGTEYDYPRQHVNGTDKYRATVTGNINIISTVKRRLVVHGARLSGVPLLILVYQT